MISLAFPYHQIQQNYHFVLDKLACDRAHAADLVVDPADVIGNASINAWFASASASLAEADDTLQNVSLTAWEDQWAARVSLARIFGTIGIASAQHFTWRNQHATGTVVGDASIAVHDWYANLHENAGSVVRAFSGVSPSSDSSLSVVRNGFASLRQASWLNSLRKLDWLLQLDDGNVVEGRSWVISFMIGRVRATNTLLTIFWAVEVVSASTDCQTAGSIINAMGSSDDNVGFFPVGTHTDQSATAEVSTVLLHADDPWVRARADFDATDDTLIIGISDTVGTHLRKRPTA